MDTKSCMHACEEAGGEREGGGIEGGGRGEEREGS